MKRARFFNTLVFAVALIVAHISVGTPLRAQTADPSSATGTINFNRVWAEATPQNIWLTVSANGHAKYISHTDARPPEEEDDYTTEFTVSPACREKLFNNAVEANYFDGDFAFKKHVVASSGKKTLSYADTTRHFNTTYDYSENKAIAETTAILLGISNTLEYGRKLKFKHRFDKLGLEDELKAMESDAENHNLAEIQLIAPELESILEDSSVLNIARQRAKKLLAKAPSN